MEMLLARTAEEGSRQLVWAAIGRPGQKDMNGAFVMNYTITEPSDFVISEKGKEAGERVWVSLSNRRSLSNYQTESTIG